MIENMEFQVKFVSGSELNFIQMKLNLYSKSMMQIHVHVSSLVPTAEFGSKNYHKDSVIDYKFIVATDKMAGMHI